MALSKVKTNMIDGTVSAITKNANDPAVDTNPTEGVGCIWQNTTSGEMYCLTDATAGANVWKNIGDGTGAIVPNVVPANPDNTAGFTATPAHNTTFTYTFSGGTDTDGTVTHYMVDQISVATNILNVTTAEVAAGQPHEFVCGTVANNTPVTFRVRTKDNSGGYSSGVTVSTTIIPWEGIVAAGGTVTTDGDYKVHTFTTSGTFAVSNVGSSGTDVEAEYLVIAGGGGGDHGGGGAGGYLLSYNCENSGANSSPLSKLTLSAQNYTVTIGAGGAKGEDNPGSNGSDTTFAGMTAVGGGLGGNRSGNSDGHDGGSGGGGGPLGTSTGAGDYGNGTANQGMNGGQGYHAWANYEASGGGGGAGQAGANNSGNTGGKGGDGMTSAITGTSVQRAGGGGGGNIGGIAAGWGGAAGAGGGGIGSGKNDGHNPGNGVANTGGGGGGGKWTGALGGSGVVIVRYKYQ